MMDKMRNVKRDLFKLIEEWNSSRLDLFHLSKPNEYLEFMGVMRFFFQDSDMKFQTKCMRVSSTMKTSDIIPMLLEKFYLVSLQVDSRKCELYEHFTNSERLLGPDEYPLLVQLNWSRIGQDGKFILRVPPNEHNGCASDASAHNSSKVNGKKSTKKSSRAMMGLENLLCGRVTNYDSVSKGCGPRIRKPDAEPDEVFSDSEARPDSRCDSPPNSTFTRMISDPEALMQKTREQVLEAKLSRIAGNGRDDRGGTLKIYGELIDPSVPYKTLLLSTQDTASRVIRQALDKYGLEFADPTAYCLVMRSRYTNEIPGMEAHEEVLPDDFCPLKLLLAPGYSPEGIVTTFELRPRLKRMEKHKNRKPNGESVASPQLLRLPFHQNTSLQSPNGSSAKSTGFACLVEMSSPNGLKPNVYHLPLHLGQVCVGTAQQSSSKFPLLVALPVSVHSDVIPFHVVIWQPSECRDPSPRNCSSTNSAFTSSSPRGWLACCPVAHESIAPVFVNGRRLALSTLRSDRQSRSNGFHWLAPGDIIQLGSSGRSKFRIWPGRCPPIPPKPPTLASPNPQRTNGVSDKLTVATPVTNCHLHCHSSGEKATLSNNHCSNQQSYPQASPNNHHHHHHICSKHRKQRSTSMDSTRSDISDSGTTATASSTGDSSTQPLSPNPPSVMEMESSETPRESLLSPTDTPVFVTSIKYTDSRMYRNRQPVKDDSSSSTTSQTLSTSGIGTCTKYTDSRSGGTASGVGQKSSSSSSGRGDGGAPPLLDMLPCQLAYAPSTLDSLLDWLVVDPFVSRCGGETKGTSGESKCALGPAFTVYLMLRAICRQCDRWETLENKKLASPSTMTELKAKQRARRQRELLTIFQAVTDRFALVERQLSEEFGKDKVNSCEELEERAKRGAALLSNISQLLHFVSKDADLQRVFQNADEKGDSRECVAKWSALVDRVAELVEAIFNLLLTTLTSLIAHKTCLPSLVAAWDLRASTCRDNEADGEEEEIEITDDTSIIDLTDPVLEELTKILTILHSNQVNPAFLVQLFARLLHYIGARLFNALVDAPMRVSPQWGRLLYEWIHKKLAGWAEPQGLRVAVECYLTRLSQAAVLMKAETETVEGLYNTAVDLDRLNSVQVRFLLRAYRPSYARPVPCVDGTTDTNADKSGFISAQWIDFIITGVSQVSDRLLAEESETPDWKPQLLESLELRLPLLLPDDCFPSSTPIRNPNLEPGSSLPTSKTLTELSASPSKGQSGAVEVSHLTSFLQPALLSGWCRLSIRQVPSLRDEAWLSWDVYLTAEADLPSTGRATQSLEDAELPRDSPGPRTPPAFEAPSPPVDQVSEIVQTEEPKSEPELSANKADNSRKVKIFTVAVPKIANNLGLSIIAARSEDGSDLGIYVKAVAQGGGASQARWLSSSDESSQPPDPVIAPGDRILAVDGQQTAGLSQDAAARLVALAGAEVRLTLARNLGLGCVAAAVPVLDSRRRNGEGLSRRNTTSNGSSTLPEHTSSGGITTTVVAEPTWSVSFPARPITCTSVVRSSTVASVRQNLEHVDLSNDSPPSPRVLVETKYLLAHEVPANGPIQRSRSFMTHDSVAATNRPSGRFSVERGSWDCTDKAANANLPFAARRNLSFKRQGDSGNNDCVPRSTRVPTTRTNWEEMDVDATLEMLKEMRDQLDKSLALRSQRGTPARAAISTFNSGSEWKSQSGVFMKDHGEPGPVNPPQKIDLSTGKSRPVWSEENSAFRTTTDGKIVRSASTYSPMGCRSSTSVGDSPRNQAVIRTPTAPFTRSGSSLLGRTCTSERIQGSSKAIYSARDPLRHNTFTDNRVGTIATARPATTRSFDFEIDHRRTRSAENALQDNLDTNRRPSVAERIKLFQNVIEGQCK